jgi:hypothetical protein
MPDKVTIAITKCYKELGYNNLMITKIVLFDSVDISEPDLTDDEGADNDYEETDGGEGTVSMIISFLFMRITHCSLAGNVSINTTTHIFVHAYNAAN